jgi:hypothetical protein
LHLNGVIESAGDHVGAAPDQRLQGTRASGEIGDIELEPLLAEQAEALGDGKRQIVQRRLSANREPHGADFGLVLR